MNRIWQKTQLLPTWQRRSEISITCKMIFHVIVTVGECIQKQLKCLWIVFVAFFSIILANGIWFSFTFLFEAFWHFVKLNSTVISLMMVASKLIGEYFSETHYNSYYFRMLIVAFIFHGVSIESKVYPWSERIHKEFAIAALNCKCLNIDATKWIRVRSCWKKSRMTVHCFFHVTHMFFWPSSQYVARSHHKY